MGQKSRAPRTDVDQPVDQHGYRRTKRVGKTRLMWEQPLGLIQGVLDEPDEWFVDPDEAVERAAIQWEGNGDGGANPGNSDNLQRHQLPVSA